MNSLLISKAGKKQKQKQNPTTVENCLLAATLTFCLDAFCASSSIPAAISLPPPSLPPPKKNVMLFLLLIDKLHALH